MKIVFIFLWIGTLSMLASETYSQNSIIQISDYQSITIEKLIQEVESQTNYLFVYSKNEINTDERISLSAQEVSVKNALDHLAVDAKISYMYDNDYIVLTKRELAYGETKMVMQGIVITGTVVDNDNQQLPGVSIVIKGTSQGTASDGNGAFSLQVPSENATLVFSYIGYTTQEIPLGSQRIIKVILDENTRTIEEVVVVGYGTQKKVNLTGAIGLADSERLENRTITSIGQGLQGVIPGLNITYNSGNPQETAKFNIRGYESINGGEPLILIDGIPMSIDKINPNDVKSVSVLKDAAAAAIYGARAAFGVILVETKKGTQGKTNISFSSQFTFNKQIFHGWEPMKKGTEGTARKILYDARKLTDGGEMFPAAVVDAALAYQELKNPTTEDAWFLYNGAIYPMENRYIKDYVFRDYAPQQQYGLNISGASEKASYFVSFGAIHKEGFFKYGNEDYKRYNVLSKIDFKVNDWISLEENVSFNTEIIDNPHNYDDSWYYNCIGRYFYAPITFPDLPYYKEPGDRAKYEHLIGMYIDNRNPIPFLKNGGRDTDTRNEIWLKQGITITPPIKGLKIKGDFSYMYNWRDSEEVLSKIDVLGIGSQIAFVLSDNMIQNGQSANDWIQNSFQKNVYYVMNAFAEYLREDLGNHRFKILAGFNQEYGRWHSVSTRTTTLLTPDIWSLSAATGTKTNSDTKNELILRGLFFRANYSYKDRYLVEINGRYDGTSRFPSKSRFGFFPSFSAGWRLSEETFMAETRKWLDNLKIRASYGELGNQVVGSYYPYIASMSKSTSNFLLNGAGTLTDFINPPSLIASTLTWEKVVSKNIGLDVTLFKNKLDVSFDFYTRDTQGMLMRKTYPGVLGASAPNENAADLRNTGWEIAVSWNDQINEDWSYRLNLSLSDYQTEITKYDNPTGNINTYYVGKKVGEIWGYKTVGLFQTDEELANSANQSRLGANWKLGDVHFADLNDDGIISTGNNTLDDHGDLIRIGNTTPRYTFGINPVIKYRNFTLDIFAQGIMKREWYPSQENYRRFWPFKSVAMEQWWIDDSWSPENRDAYFPLKQWHYGDSKNTATQTRYLQNAAYIRLKNVTLSYRIPLKFVSEAQIYLNGTNLWEASGMYKTLDPEYSSDLMQRYAFQRAFTIGLKLTL